MIPWRKKGVSCSDKVLFLDLGAALNNVSSL